MKALIIIAGILVVVGLPMCGYTVYRTIQNFPEEAERDNLYRKHASLLAQIDTAIEQSDSLLSLGAALEKIDYPPGTIHVGIWQDDKVMEIIEAPKAGSKTQLIVNGAGYGRIGSRHFWIIQYEMKRYEQDHIKIFIEREQ